MESWEIFIPSETASLYTIKRTFADSNNKKFIVLMYAGKKRDLYVECRLVRIVLK